MRWDASSPVIARFTILAVSLLWASSVAAQSAAELQAIGQAAAAKYGVPWEMFKAQISGESSWNPNIGCNSSGACGIAQFIGSTAKEYGVNTNDVTSSLEGAARYDAALYQQTGSWAGALTKYTGGLTPSHPGNASYATAFADAQASDAGGVGLGGTPLGSTGVVPAALGGSANPDALGTPGNPITLGDGSLIPGSSAAIPTAATVEPPTFRAFTWVWNQYVGTVQQPLQAQTSQITAKAGGLFGVLALLAVAATGIGLSLGLKTSNDLIRKALKIAFVGGMVGAASLYQPYWVDLVNSIPAWLGQGMDLQGGAAGPAGSFDNVAVTFLVAAQKTMATFPFFSGEMLLDMGLLIIAGIVLSIPLLVMFAIWFSAQIVMQFLLILGGLLLLALLSDYTEQVFFKYVHSFISLSAISFVAIVIAVLVLKMMLGVFDAIPHAGTSTAMAANLLEATLAIAAVAMVLAIIWQTVEHFTGAAGASGHISRNVQNIAARGSAAAASIGVPGAATVNNIVSFRRTTSVGRSLSRGA